ncbi:MAG: right-handed parallel beta-helix repeat-containing protein [Bryobacteraceae bacterium]|nr:right-handed parallel beta-helix repeat-containing protein [Bryobacteraceae bacterium]
MPKSLAALGVLCLFGCARGEFKLTQTTGVVRLPAGIVEVARELEIAPGAHDLEIVGAPEGTTLRAAAGFDGRAVLSFRDAKRIRLQGFTIDGNRLALEQRTEIPPSDIPFIDYFCNNGVIAQNAEELEISSVRFVNIANFAVIVSESRNIVLDKIEVSDSGSRNAAGRNNTSGGVLLEEGVQDFTVRDGLFVNVLGNGVWTHSLYTSPRNRKGVVAGNAFRNIGRDAIQVGHATEVLVERNTGEGIGYPVDAVDVEGGGTPVAIDTAGDVDATIYRINRFEEINGKCVDLDGFHDGEVSGNVCVNKGRAEDYPFGHYGIVMNNANPDMNSRNIRIADNVIDGVKFGGIFVIGSGHRVENNTLRNVNAAGCNESGARFGCLHFPDEPDILRSGIYLGRGAERPDAARDNLVQGNEITGHGMAARCVGFAPGVSRSANRVRNNRCADGKR